jgi:hypothetical protein
MAKHPWIRNPFARTNRTSRTSGVRLPLGARLAFDLLEERTLLSINTAISISASSAALLSGQSTTFIATVSYPSDQSVTRSPTGTVTFYDGSTVLGTQALSRTSPTVTLTTSGLSVGTHRITADYSGDANFDASRTGVEPTAVATIVETPLLFSATGVAVDDAGNTFVADPQRTQIIKVPAGGGAFSMLGSGLHQPFDIELDSAGNLLVADFSNDRIVKITPTSTTDVASDLDNPLSMALDGDGNLYVSTTNSSLGGVLKIAPDGSRTVVGTGLTFPGSVAVDGSGNVFIVDVAFGRLVKVAADGTQTTLLDQLTSNGGVAADSFGHVYFAQPSLNRIIELRPDGTQFNVGTGLTSAGIFSVDSAGNLYVGETIDSVVKIKQLAAGVTVSVRQVQTAISVSASTAVLSEGQSLTFTATLTIPAGDPIPTSSDGTVTFYDGTTVLGTKALSDSSPTATLTTSALSVGDHVIFASYSGTSKFAASRSHFESDQTVVPTTGLQNPGPLAVDKDGNLFIGDNYLSTTGHNEVYKVTPSGTQTIFKLVSTPTDLLAHDDGDVYVGEFAKVSKVAANGTETVLAIGSALPSSVALDPDGNIYIGELGGSVLKIPSSGDQSRLAIFGLKSPSQLALDPTGSLYIVDADAKNVVRYKPNGSWSTFASGFNFPTEVITDGDGNVYIADGLGNRVVEIRPNGVQTTIGTGLVTPAGLAFDKAGNLYIAEAHNKRILKLTPGVHVKVNVAVVHASITGAPGPGDSFEGTSIDLSSEVTDSSQVLAAAAGFTYAWSVTKNGNPFAKGNEASFSFTPDDNGTYVVSFSATNQALDVGSDTETILVDNLGPTATITGVPASGQSPEGTTINLGTSVTDPSKADTDAGFGYAWSVIKNDNVAYATGNEANFSFTPDDDGIYVVYQVVKDKDSYASVKTQTIRVDDVAPTAAITGAPGRTTEGTVINLGSTVTEPSSVDAASSTYAWSVTKNGKPYASGSTANFSFTPDDQGVYVVRFNVIDTGGQTAATASKTIIADSVVPRADISGPSTGVRGQDRTFTLIASDPSSADQAAGFVFCITWGDGYSQTVVGLSGTTVSHIFTASGNYSVKVTARDKDGCTSSIVKLTETITAAALQADPSDPSKTALFVGGTTSADTIILKPADVSGTMNVKIGSTNIGNFKPTGRIVVYGQSGNDMICLQTAAIGRTTAYVSAPAYLFGDGGNDSINTAGSTANNVLVGGLGSDNLQAGRGRDLIIGGLGADTLRGDAGSDIVIGGTTDFDNNLLALNAIMSEWGNNGDYTTRVKHLNGTLGVGLNGSYTLTSSTVRDDAASDTLYGGSDTDWLFARLSGSYKDSIKDAVSGEVITAP